MNSNPLFGNLFDKFKSSTKQAAEQVKLTGRIAGLKVEKSTQRAERERLLKDIGSKAYSIYYKNKDLDIEILKEEILNELHHIDRIDSRLEEIEEEITQLRNELTHKGESEAEEEDIEVETIKKEDK